MPNHTNVSEPPSGLPNSLSDGLQRQDDETLVDIISYSRDLLDYLQRPVEDLTDEGEELVNSMAIEDGETWTRVVKRVPCGKNCNGCPHGPYLYLVRRVSLDRLEWQYVGKASEAKEKLDELDFPDADGTPDGDDEKTDTEEVPEEEDESALEGGIDDASATYPSQDDADDEDDNPYPDQ